MLSGTRAQMDITHGTTDPQLLLLCNIVSVCLSVCLSVLAYMVIFATESATSAFLELLCSWGSFMTCLATHNDSYQMVLLVSIYKSIAGIINFPWCFLYMYCWHHFQNNNNSNNEMPSREIAMTTVHINS